MKVIDRIKIFIEAENLSKSQFERSVGLSNGYISNLKGEVGADKIAKILERYPLLNSTWLLLGDGEMYKSVKDVNSDKATLAIAQGVNNQITLESERLITLLENKDKQMERLIELLESKLNK